MMKYQVKKTQFAYQLLAYEQAELLFPFREKSHPHGLVTGKIMSGRLTSYLRCLGLFLQCEYCIYYSSYYMQ